MRKNLYKKMVAECQKKGMTQKQINKIENAYDSERKKMKRENEQLEKQGITVTLFSAYDDKPGMMDKLLNEAGKQGRNPLEDIIHKEMHETLTAGLESLDEDDREFLLELFFAWEGNVKGYAESLDVPREAVRDRRNRILRKLKSFFEKNGFFDAAF